MPKSVPPLNLSAMFPNSLGGVSELVDILEKHTIEQLKNTDMSVLSPQRHPLRDHLIPLPVLEAHYKRKAEQCKSAATYLECLVISLQVGALRDFVRETLGVTDAPPAHVLMLPLSLSRHLTENKE